MSIIDDDKIKIAKHDPKARAIPGKGYYSLEAQEERLTFLRKELDYLQPETLDKALNFITDTFLKPEQVLKNTENYIGTVQIPVGIAGPLMIKGDHVKRVQYVPMATTEGSLIASTTRGAKAITLSGGCHVKVIDRIMNRVPVFQFHNKEEAVAFKKWFSTKCKGFTQEAESYSRYAQLESIEPILVDERVFLECRYKTGDAAGQNMTTVCTWHACQWLKHQAVSDGITILSVHVASSVSGDKKVCSRNSFPPGSTARRGTHVIATCNLTDAVISKELKSSRSQLLSAFETTKVSAKLAGMLAFNVNVANVIAALFTAAGQDIGSVHESSIAEFKLVPRPNNELHASVRLPCLIVGTVGGGTQLPTQQSILALLGCQGPSSSLALAEIIAATALALELSTFSAIAADHFAQAHDKLGRNRPMLPLKVEELNLDYFRAIAQQLGEKRKLMQADIQPMPKDSESIVTELTGQVISDKWVGLSQVKLRWAEDQPAHSEDRSKGRKLPNTWFIKSKPTSEEVYLALKRIASISGEAVQNALTQHASILPINQAHTRELNILARAPKELTSIAPETYHIWRDNNRQIYLLVQPFLQNIELMNSVNHPQLWKRKHLLTAITDISPLHALAYSKKNEIPENLSSLQLYNPRLNERIESIPLWSTLINHGIKEHSDWFCTHHHEKALSLLAEAPIWMEKKEKLPKGFIHNDFNPRNLAFLTKTEGISLCAYDWELAAFDLPQRDLIELLVFTLTPQTDTDDLATYINTHRVTLGNLVQSPIHHNCWFEGVRLSLYDFIVTRLPIYYLIDTLKTQKFLPRVHNSAFRLLTMLDQIQAHESFK